MAFLVTNPWRTDTIKGGVCLWNPCPVASCSIGVDISKHLHYSTLTDIDHKAKLALYPFATMYYLIVLYFLNI